MRGQGAGLLRIPLQEYAITSLGHAEECDLLFSNATTGECVMDYYEPPRPEPEPDHPRWDAMGGHGYCKDRCYNHAYAINDTHDGMHKACEMMACDFESGECEVDLACGTQS